jgi:hypothetical protein
VLARSSTRCARSPGYAIGLNHGDIRNDHLFVDADGGRLRWIDFDRSSRLRPVERRQCHVVAARRVVIRDVLNTRPGLAAIGLGLVFFPTGS